MCSPWGVPAGCSCGRLQLQRSLRRRCASLCWAHLVSANFATDIANTPCSRPPRLPARPLVRSRVRVLSLPPSLTASLCLSRSLSPPLSPSPTFVLLSSSSPSPSPSHSRPLAGTLYCTAGHTVAWPGPRARAGARFRPGPGARVGARYRRPSIIHTVRQRRHGVSPRQLCRGAGQ